MKPVQTNFVPLTRSKSRACEETSIVTACEPFSKAKASNACNSGASGVVLALGKLTPAIEIPAVPKRDVGMPHFSKPARINQADVVFPLVPVIPKTFRDCEGFPKTKLEISPKLLRGFSIFTIGKSLLFIRFSPWESVKTATAPLAFASATKFAPWFLSPFKATNKSPGSTLFVLCVIPVIFCSGFEVCKLNFWASSPNDTGFTLGRANFISITTPLDSQLAFR